MEKCQLLLTVISLFAITLLLCGQKSAAASLDASVPKLPVEDATKSNLVDITKSPDTETTKPPEVEAPKLPETGANKSHEAQATKPPEENTTKQPPVVSTKLPGAIIPNGDPASVIVTVDACGLSLVSPDEKGSVTLSKCHCSNLNEDVDCSNLEVTELPKLLSFPKTARNVNFLGNKIQNIEEDTFYSGRSVIELDLSHNHIDFISSVAFKAFKSLRELDLSHNRIWNMPTKSFQGLSELRYLDLSYNDLVTLSSDLFSQTTGLKELFLEANSLQELEPKVFEHLQNLEVLSLEHTSLKVIPDHLFLFSPHLKMLDLSNNLLTQVPTDALRLLDQLKVLDISGNPIPVIKSEAFLGLRRLVILYLDRMHLLTHIEKYAFGDLLLLEEMHCSYNFMLTDLDENAFVRKIDNKKVALTQLFLSQNSLEEIPKDLLNWNEDIELHIGENPLSCDCHAQWMVNIKLKNEFQTHAKCYTPSHLLDTPLSKLKDYSLSCGMSLTEMVLIAIAVVFAIIVIVLIVLFLIWKRSFNGYRRPYFKVKRKNVEEIDYRGDDCM